MRANFNKAITAIGGCLCLGVVVLATSPGTASAAFERHSPASCFSEDGDLARRFSLDQGFADIYCELPNRSGFESEDITSVSVFTWLREGSFSGSTTARVCGTDRNANSATCGVEADSLPGLGGYSEIVLDSEAEIGWLDDANRADWFATLHVEMVAFPVPEGVPVRRFLGYVARDN